MKKNIQHSTFNIQYSPQKGFTLVEMVVSLGLFTIVLFMATSAFLTIVNADRKSRATRIAIDNLNLALEDMVRRIKTGTTYNCGGTVGVTDCASGNNTFAFDAVPSSGSKIRTKYWLATGATCGTSYKAGQGCIMRTEDLTTGVVTSPEIDIKGLKFVVSGSYPWGVAAGQDKKQPAVIIAIDGVIGANSPSGAGKSAFKIQTSITQRKYDH